MHLLILVKPKDVEHTLLSVKDVLDPKTLVVSCAAGLPLSRLRGAVKPEQDLAGDAEYGRTVWEKLDYDCLRENESVHGFGCRI